MKQTYLIAGLEPCDSTSIHDSMTMESVVGIVGEKTKLDDEGAQKLPSSGDAKRPQRGQNEDLSKKDKVKVKLIHNRTESNRVK